MASTRMGLRARDGIANENENQQSRQLRMKAAGGVQRTALGEIGNNKTTNILGWLFSSKINRSKYQNAIGSMKHTDIFVIKYFSSKERK